MADPATKTSKGGNAAAPAATLSSHREQKLRAVQIRKIGTSALKPLGYGDSQILTATAPAGMTFADAMLPAVWGNVAPIPARDALSTRNLRDGVGCLIIIEPEDGAWHAWLRIAKVVRDNMGNPCGFDLVCIGPAQDKDGKGCPRDLKTGLPWVDPTVEAGN